MAIDDARLRAELLVLRRLVEHLWAHQLEVAEEPLVQATGIHAEMADTLREQLAGATMDRASTFAGEGLDEAWARIKDLLSTRGGRGTLELPPPAGGIH